jgi:hypothetical protein
MTGMLGSRFRSSQAEVRNPVLGLPGAAALAGLSDDSRAALRAVLLDIKTDARARSEACWRRHKGPMALYWKVRAVYAGHIARLLRPRDDG